MPMLALLWVPAHTVSMLALACEILVAPFGSVPFIDPEMSNRNKIFGYSQLAEAWPKAGRLVSRSPATATIAVRERTRIRISNKIRGRVYQRPKRLHRGKCSET